MDGLQGQIRETVDAAPQISSQPKTGNFGKEVGRSVDVVEEESQRKEVPDAENDAPEQHGSTRPEETSRKVPPTQDRAPPHRAIPEVDEELQHGGASGTQTREHLFKNCDRWRPQQKIMWAEIRKKTGRGKNRFTIREMFADERRTGAVLGLLRTTKVGARMGPRERLLEPGGGEREEGDTRSH